MKSFEKIARWFQTPALSPGRIGFAITVAVLTDGLQLTAGPLGWVGLDQVLDVVAMALTTRALGFHLLLLPTFVIEALPIADALPTWTACTLAVIALRRRGGKTASPDAEPPPIAQAMPGRPATKENQPVIDI